MLKCCVSIVCKAPKSFLFWPSKFQNLSFRKHILLQQCSLPTIWIELCGPHYSIPSLFPWRRGGLWTEIVRMCEVPAMPFMIKLPCQTPALSAVKEWHLSRHLQNKCFATEGSQLTNCVISENPLGFCWVSPSWLSPDTHFTLEAFNLNI